MTGETLRTQRIRLGWSREQLAHTVGVPAARVAAWENDGAPIDCPRAVEQVLGRGKNIRTAAPGVVLAHELDEIAPARIDRPAARRRDAGLREESLSVHR